ncbi:DUF4087 domain-containing protein [Cronobacter turicensis]|nr:DUF4087 domain-containing protein [Cronobacter turicensis]
MIKYNLFLFLLLCHFFTFSKEIRCGWLENPTPSNIWLADKDGEWVISLQGDREAIDIERLSGFSEKEYLNTNGNYGYGCACLLVDIDKAGGFVTKIYHSDNVSLAKCKNDAALKATTSKILKEYHEK